jgi:hypothetical protein
VKPVAVEGCTFRVKEANIAFLTAKILTPASGKVSVDGKGAYFGTLTVSVSGIKYMESYVVANPVVFTISPTAEKVSSHGENAVLDGDESATVSEIVGVKTPQDVKKFSMTIYIEAAGQDPVKAD